MILHNLTTWQFPVDLHTKICDQLKINPRVYVLPPSVKELLSEHVGGSDMLDVDAFADEMGNTVYFWHEDWTVEFSSWVVCHELYHVSQYFDNGNVGGRRWDHMPEEQKTQTWEDEACAFAHQHCGFGVLGRDFPQYTSERADKKKWKRRGTSTRSASQFCGWQS